MAKRQYANDWTEHSPGVEYSKDLDLYYHNGRHYDRLSASHNGIIGLGALLKTIIKEKCNG